MLGAKLVAPRTGGRHPARRVTCSKTQSTLPEEVGPGFLCRTSELDDAYHWDVMLQTYPLGRTFRWLVS
jgi:hypothetical protein